MDISVFGLGYVGAVSIGCLAKLGHRVLGVDPIEAKVQSILDGKAPVIEADLEALIQSGIQQQQIQATQSVNEAIQKSDLSLICVGTPSRRDGSLNMDYVTRVCTQIGEAIAKKDSFHTVAIRSTVIPGFAEEYGLRALEKASGKKNGLDFGFGVNPEFLREGTAVADFFEPPFTVVGANEAKVAEVISSIYTGIEAPVITLDINTASMVKYTCNAFHALKIAFANEIGSLCRILDVDSHKVMDVVCQDTKLNISRAYLKPGFAFGGSCLPKDLRAILDTARQHALQVPTLGALLDSNDLLVRRFVDEVVQLGKRKIAVLGLAFKEGTDDLRESPLVTVVESLLGKGHSIQIYDRNVSLAKLVGANKKYIEHEIPHISSMLTQDLDGAISDCEVAIIGNRDESFRAALEQHGKHCHVFDLVRLFDNDQPAGASYQGIAW